MLARVDLGTAPGPLEKADAQAMRFKAMMREHLRGVDGVSLLSVKDVDTRELRVEAVYDRGDRLAEAGAEQALELAESIWDLVRKAGTRELLRGR